MNFLEMLLVSRKMNFQDGKIILCGQDILIFPPTSLVEYLLQVHDDEELTKLMYSTIKESMLEYKQNFADVYKASEGPNWICNFINLYSHGKIKYESISGELTGTLIMENPALSALTNKITSPVDHITRGLIAGVISSVSNQDIDVIEVECSMSGNKNCKFIIASKENLKTKFPSFYNNQI